MSRVLRSLVATFIVGSGVIAGPTAARAAVADVTCTPPGSVLVTYSPPLTLTPQNVTITVNSLYAPCVSPTVPALTSGSTNFTFQATNRSCANLLGPASASPTVTWNTGQSTTMSVNSTANIVGGVYTVVTSGAVTGGLFAGDTVLQNATGPATDILLCLLGLGSVSSVYTVGTTVITSV
jgi:hypothetical protein